MRAWFNGRMEASQALDEGSIPFARFFSGTTMENENLDLEAKPAGNKDLWLFLIILDLIFLCVFGFFIYKYFAARVFDASARAPRAEQTEEVQAPVLPAEAETIVVEENVPVQAAVPAAEPVEIPVTAVLEQEAKKAAEEKQAQEAAKAAAKQAEKAAEAPKQSVLVAVNPKSSKYRRVTFRWYGEGNKVAVVSGFTMAKPQALTKRNGYWETTLSIAPGTYKFLYVIDGKNTLDPYSDQKDGRSVLVVQ